MVPIIWATLDTTRNYWQVPLDDPQCRFPHLSHHLGISVALYALLAPKCPATFSRLVSKLLLA